MSINMNSWKYKESTIHDHEAVYQKACCNGEFMEELEILPMEEILMKLVATLSAWTVDNDGKNFKREGHGSFEVFKTSQIVRFDCCDMAEADLNMLMDVLMEFGCPLYDSQISERFDSWTDR